MFSGRSYTHSNKYPHLPVLKLYGSLVSTERTTIAVACNEHSPFKFPYQNCWRIAASIMDDEVALCISERALTHAYITVSTLPVVLHKNSSLDLLAPHDRTFPPRHKVIAPIIVCNLRNNYFYIMTGLEHLVKQILSLQRSVIHIL